MDILHVGEITSRPEQGASQGKIALCPHNGCNFCCTEFTSGNYIVLYPGELAAAVTQGHSVSHLTVIDENDHGGARAICEARDRKTCDGGYKPLDCASYPFFPTVGESRHAPVGVLKGTKCPLNPADITAHERWVKGTWQALAAKHPVIWQWLKHVRLVGYEPVDAQGPGADDGT